MDPQLCQFIENKQNLLSNYDQSLYVNVNNVLVDISCSIGPNAITPPRLVDQPPSYPEHSKFRFPTKHKGCDALGDIMNILKKGWPVVIQSIIGMVLEGITIRINFDEASIE